MSTAWPESPWGELPVYRPWGVRGPIKRTRDMLAAVDAVLGEYRQWWPLSARQIYYRLVGLGVVAKGEDRKVYYALRQARWSGRIPFSAFRDDGITSKAPAVFDDPADFWTTVNSWAEDAYGHDRQAGQERYIEVFCEAAGNGRQPCPVGREPDLRASAPLDAPGRR